MGRNKTQKKKYGGSPKDDSDNNSSYSLKFEDVRAELAAEKRAIDYNELIDKINKNIISAISMATTRLDELFTQRWIKIKHAMTIKILTSSWSLHMYYCT